MLDFLLTSEALFALLTLTFLEIILGIDNIIFISIIANKLPENQRVAMQMRDAGGLSMDELCNILEVSPSNIRVLLHRARDKVLQVIDHFQKTGEC